MRSIKGFSLIETLVVIGIMGVVLTAFMSMTESQSKQIKFIEAKQEAIDIKNSLFRSFGGSNCCPVGSNTGFGDLTYTAGSPEVNIQRIFSQCQTATVPSPQVLVDLMNANLQNELRINSIKLVNISQPDATLAPNDFYASLQIDVDAKAGGQTKMKPISINSISFHTNPTTNVIESCTSSAAEDSSPNGKKVYFGGMYGYSSNPALWNNPITGSKSCPAGYTSAPIFGSRDTDYEIRVCFAFDNFGISNYYAYGGSFGDSVNSSQHVNPITGAKTCPAGYTRGTVLGTINVDYQFYFCYKNLGSTPPDSTNSYRFGGLWGVKAIPDPPNPADSFPYNNPVTGSASCPSGMTEATVFGTINKDWPITVCR